MISVELLKNFQAVDILLVPTRTSGMSAALYLRPDNAALVMLLHSQHGNLMTFAVRFLIHFYSKRKKLSEIMQFV